MSMTEYGESINALVTTAFAGAEELVGDTFWMADGPPQQLQATLRATREIRIPLQEGADSLVPPTQISDLHDLMWTWHSRMISVEEALATRAGLTEDSGEGWTALSESPEMAAYRSALIEGKQICADFQGTLDATASRGAFADTAWLPTEMKEVVEAALGCQLFPEDPEDVYRYPPAP